MPPQPRPPKLFRIRGRAPDGLVVTLGSYDTEPEAQSDFERLGKEARYRELEIQPIPPKVPAAQPET
jgi:hypothetical protein